MSELQSTWRQLAKGLAEEEGDAHAAVLLLGTVLDMLSVMAERLARVEGSVRGR